MGPPVGQEVKQGMTVNSVQVFVSWSGTLSKRVALALRRWLPDVFPSVSVWMSEEDTGAGSRWSQELVNQLDRSGFGIVCLTRENQLSPWLLFEAGALIKTAGITRVVPYLVGMSTTDVQYPLALFQGVEATERGTLQLLRSINDAGSLEIPDDRVTRIHHRWWPDLEQVLQSLQQLPVPAEKSRSDRELLEETIALLRDSNRRTFQYPFFSIARPESVILDLQPFFPERGTLYVLEYQSSQSVSSFIDKIYFILNEVGRVPAFQYGTSWCLEDVGRGKRYDDIGIEHCRTHGQVRDERPIESVGIRPGDRLAVIPLQRQQVEESYST
jgi:hypothetical protein